MTTVLTASELVVLGALDGLVEPASQDAVACELAAGHEDVHAAFVVASDGGDRWWWIRWNAMNRRLSCLQTCDRADQLTGDDCLLPQKHPGRHTFEM
ncbi:hypothetical protein AB0368_06825 [Actinoplanes sp. NPDC051475]|uniref:hypothetical protein n=1 Tax=Actinoplanes sp. NPDC051475 TaxID=3157225 RepID=UPI00344E56F5